MPNETQIRTRMTELARILEYDYRDLTHLSRALYCKRQGRKNYTTDAMATLGDAVLKLIFSEHFFAMGLDKDEITRRKIPLEKNATLKAMCDKLGIYPFAYNDQHFGDEATPRHRLPYGAHDFYLEAIVAAVYLDRGQEYTRQWVLELWKKYSGHPL